MSLTETSNQLFLPGGVQQTRKIAHISQFGPYTKGVNFKIGLVSVKYFWVYLYVVLSELHVYISRSVYFSA